MNFFKTLWFKSQEYFDIFIDIVLYSKYIINIPDFKIAVGYLFFI